MAPNFFVLRFPRPYFFRVRRRKTISSTIQSSSTERLPGDDVQDKEESECDLNAELQIGRKFNSFDEVEELLGKFKASGHPMRVFNSQSVEEYNRRRVKAKIPLEPIVNGSLRIMLLLASILASLVKHIKTHLWDLSTNLSKLNIFLKLKNIVLYES